MDISLPVKFQLVVLAFWLLVPALSARADLPTNLSLKEPWDPPYQELHRQMTVRGQPLQIRVFQWLGERNWGTYVLDLAAAVLPALQQELGIPLPFYQILIYEVRESRDGVVGSEEGGEIRLAHDASEHTTVHELAHLWLDFNFHEQWVREGFADLLAYRSMQVLGMTSDVLQERMKSFQRRCGAADWPLVWWTRSHNLDPFCGYGKAAVFVSLLYQVLGVELVRSVLQQLYMRAPQGLSFQEELLSLNSPAGPQEVARLFSGWVNPGPYYYGLARF